MLLNPRIHIRQVSVRDSPVYHMMFRWGKGISWALEASFPSFSALNFRYLWPKDTNGAFLEVIWPQLETPKNFHWGSGTFPFCSQTLLELQVENAYYIMILYWFLL